MWMLDKDTIKVVLSLFAVASYPVVSFADEPSESLIEAYIEDRLPRYLEIDSFDALILPSADAGAGRISAEVVIELNEDVFQREGFSRIERELFARGFEGDEADFFIDAIIPRSRQDLYVLSIQHGTTYTFYPELQYRQTIRGFSFSGNLDAPSIRGLVRSELPVNHYCLGDSDCREQYNHLIDTLVTERQAHLESIDTIKSITREHFNGFSLVAGDDYRDRSWRGEFLFDNLPNIGFVSDPIDLSYHYYDPEHPDQIQLWNDTGIVWRREGEWSSARFAAGERATMRIIFTYRNIRSGVGGMPPFDLEVLIIDPNTNERISQPDMTDFEWDGEYFANMHLADSGVSIGRRIYLVNSQDELPSLMMDLEDIGDYAGDIYEVTGGDHVEFDAGLDDPRLYRFMDNGPVTFREAVGRQWGGQSWCFEFDPAELRVVQVHSLWELDFAARGTPPVETMITQRALEPPNMDDLWCRQEDADEGSPIEQTLAIGTGRETGVYYPTGLAIRRLVNAGQAEHGIDMSVESTEGSVFNLIALANGEMDMAVVQSDWQHVAYHDGHRTYDLEANSELRAVFSIYGEPLTIVARADSGIETFEDLRGRRVNVGDPGSGARGMMERLMHAHGWNMGDYFARATELARADQIQALCRNDVDAIVFTVGHPSRSVHEATTNCDGYVISIEGEGIDHFIEEHPFLSYWTIPSEFYENNYNDVRTFGVKATFVTTAALSADVVYAIVRSVFDNLAQFKSLNPAFQTLTPEDMANTGLSAPIHEGAMRYYCEVELRDDC